MKKTFYVLTDDKVGSGPRLRPQALLKEPGQDKNAGDGVGTSASSGAGQELAISMETDSIATVQVSQPTSDPPRGVTLSAKLAAKRKASEAADSPSKARR